MLFAPDWKRDTAHQAATDPPPAQAMFARWVADLLARGDHEQALRRAEIGTDHFPGYATGWYALAQAQKANGSLRDAVASAEHCLAIEPDFFAAWDLLAELWSELKVPAAARAARARRDEFLHVGRPEREAAETPGPIPPADEPQPTTAQKVVLKRPSETARVFETPTLAEVYRRQGLLDRALAVYRKILERHPEDAGAKSMVRKLEDELSSRHKPMETP